MKAYTVCFLLKLQEIDDSGTIHQEIFSSTINVSAENVAQAVVIAIERDMEITDYYTYHYFSVIVKNI